MNTNRNALWRINYHRDFDVQTDHEIETRRPDLIVIDKANKQCNIIGLAIPFDSGLVEKEREKN